VTVKLEICTASVEDCVAAERGGATRVELNCALMLGGLTPTLGTLREAIAICRLPIISMLRPRAAGFCYSPSEFKVMLRDAELALEAGAAGIAFGILTADGHIDIERCRTLQRLMDAATLSSIAPSMSFPTLYPPSINSSTWASPAS